MTDAPPPDSPPPSQPPVVIQCPQCRQLTNTYCAINERVALCPPCTEKLRQELTVLDGMRLFRGVAYALGCAFAVCTGVNVLLVSLGDKHSASGWIQSISAIFMGMVVGRTARKGSVAGGLPLQLATIAITLVAVLEITAGPIYADAVKNGNGPAIALVFGLIASPVALVLTIPSNPIILFWLFWAIYDPWRATAPVQLRIGGPFPVKAPDASAAPPAQQDAKAAGLDFERPQ